MIFSIVLILLLFIISLCAPSSINLTCDRYQYGISSAINCQLIRQDIWGLRKIGRKIAANNYQSIIEEVYLGSTQNPNYELILLADDQRIKITRFSRLTSDNDLWTRQNKLINDFFSDKDSYHLEVGKDNSYLIFDCFSSIFILAIICLIIIGSKIDIRYTLCKESNTLSICRYNSLTKIVREINFDEIEKVFLEKDNDIDGSTSRIVFRLNSGENIPLASWTNSFDGKDKIFKRIRQFLS